MDTNEAMNLLIKNLEDLESTYKDYVSVNIEYIQKKSELWLDTDFATVLGSKRPTVDEKKAYVNMESLKLREARDELYYRAEYLRYKIEGYEKIIGVCDE